MRRRPILVALLIAGVIGTAAPAPAAVLGADPSPLESQWRLDETSGTVAHDSVGSHPGTISGATSVADGAVGRALRFDGGDGISIPDAAAFRSKTMFLSFWVRGDPESPPQDGAVIAEKGNILCGPGGKGYAIVVDGRFVAVHYRDHAAITVDWPNTVDQDAAIASLWDGGWHHVTMSAYTTTGYSDLHVIIDGWDTGGTFNGNTDGIDYGVAPFAPLSLGRDDQACAAGYVGDLDNVRLFDAPPEATLLTADEPRITSSLAIDDVEPAKVDDTSWVDVTLLPAPGRPGILYAYVRGDDGVEHRVGAKRLQFWELDPDGHYRVSIDPETGGASTVRVRYEPDPGPASAAEDTASTTIAKQDSQARVNLQTRYVPYGTINLAVGVYSGISIPVTGTGKLYEKIGDDLVLIASGPLARADGSVLGYLDVNLPPRPLGTYRFVAEYLGSTSYLPSISEETTLEVLPDIQPPVVRDISVALELGAKAKGIAPIRLSWRGEDDGAIDHYAVQIQQDGGAWTDLVASTTASSLTTTLGPGATHRFRIQATDRAGLESGWWESDPVVVYGYQQTNRAIRYGGTWSTSKSGSFWGGSTKKASIAGKTATFTFTGTDVGWVTPLGPSRGSAKVYVDGKYVKTVSLYRSSNTTPRIAFIGHWSVSGEHTVKIKVVGTKGHGRIDLDGFIVLDEPDSARRAEDRVGRLVRHATEVPVEDLLEDRFARVRAQEQGHGRA